jgi:hypothetical protein
MDLTAANASPLDELRVRRGAAGGDQSYQPIENNRSSRQQRAGEPRVAIHARAAARGPSLASHVAGGLSRPQDAPNPSTKANILRSLVEKAAKHDPFIRWYDPSIPKVGWQCVERPSKSNLEGVGQHWSERRA